MRSKKGFTLIELLVVIAIIALLLAILVPSLNKVKEKAKEVICRTHLRGVGMALLLYLEDYDGRAYNSSSNNRHYWYNANGTLRNPNSNCYWGVAYVKYAEDPKVFGCPTYARVFDMLYDPGDLELAPYAGFGLNAFFFRDAEMVLNGTTGPGRYNRKVTNIKSPFQFIVSQDHVEPRCEGWSGGGEGNDQMYIPRGRSFNLGHYRTGSRRPYYWGLFRHSKKNRGLDDPTEEQARRNRMNDNPNGNNNALCLDGSVESIRETTGENIKEIRYSGISQIH
ncbi:MAG: prepilin-type N-terminal cleavage/methylation domain-containing protein [Dehalococcoidales bacterium]